MSEQFVFSLSLFAGCALRLSSVGAGLGRAIAGGVRSSGAFCTGFHVCSAPGHTLCMAQAYGAAASFSVSCALLHATQIRGSEPSRPPRHRGNKRDADAPADRRVLSECCLLVLACSSSQFF